MANQPVIQYVLIDASLFNIWVIDIMNEPPENDDSAVLGFVDGVG